jgi:glycosyltransferase involved in cell wall biosynthesis
MKSAAPYHLAVDARPLTGPPNGYTTYLASIIEPLLSAGWQITLLANSAIDPAYHYTRDCQIQVFGPTGSVRWEQVALPRHLRAYRYDVYFAPTNRGIPLVSVAPTRTILGLLDVIPFKFPRYYLPAAKFHFVRHGLGPELSSVARADVLTTISVTSATDIQRYFHRRATPLLLRLPSYRRQPVRQQDQFVYVGGVDPRKRIDSLIHAFAEFAGGHPTYKLVLIGRGYERFMPLCRQLNIADQVQLAGRVSDQQKMQIIGASRALVYPSLYEGYGLAIAEGLQAGVPVIAGHGGAQAEIGEDAVLYIDPKNPADIARAMHDVLDPAVAKRLRQRGDEQLERLTSPKVEERIVRFFTTQASQARKVTA